MDRFPYQDIEASPSYGDMSSVIWRPMVPFSIRGLSGREKTDGLVDTGACETLLPMEFWGLVEPAHREGEECDLVAANGTKIRVKYGTVDLGIRLGPKRHWWRAKVGFTKDRNESVLGDAAFMRYFAVYFHRPQCYLTVRKVRALPQPIFTPPAITPQMPGTLPR
jgi:hypothetical protein